MNGTSAIRITPKLIIGLGILALGILWTLDNLDYLDSDRITEWWPVIIIVVGLVKIMEKPGRVAGGIIAIVGVVILLDNLSLIRWDVGDLFPLLIALLGAKLIWDAVRRRQSAPAPTDDASSAFHAFALMAGIHRNITSAAFHGGDANAIMGGVEIDLRNAQLKDGEAVIDAFALWGGVEITVPDNWRIDGEVLPLLGGFDDKTANRSGSGPRLLVRGAAVMGAIVVKN